MISRRPGETKLGETLHTFTDDWRSDLQSTTAEYVLLGIPEDIGVRANLGVGGAHTLWEPALKAILNIQETDILQGNRIAVLGAFDFADMMQNAAGKPVDALRDMVAEIDDIVFPVIQQIAAAGKKPVVIGGGHNNAYPILKGISRAREEAVNCINLDAHSDYRAIEGRHSGNGFRYARMDGYLGRYVVMGLHHNYNSQAVLNDLTGDKDIRFSFYEDLFLWEHQDFRKTMENSIRFASGGPVGIELDLDCIANTLSSAATPCGITPLQARKFLITCAQLTEPVYLHFTEGSVELADGRRDPMTAKLVAYLFADFIRTAANEHTVVIRNTQL